MMGKTNFPEILSYCHVAYLISFCNTLSVVTFSIFLPCLIVFALFLKVPAAGVMG